MVGPYDQFHGISRTCYYGERPNKWHSHSVENRIKLQLFYEKALNSKIIKKIHCFKISFEKNKLLCSTPYAFRLLCPYSKNCSAW